MPGPQSGPTQLLRDTTTLQPRLQIKAGLHQHRVRCYAKCRKCRNSRWVVCKGDRAVERNVRYVRFLKFIDINSSLTDENYLICLVSLGKVSTVFFAGIR